MRNRLLAIVLALCVLLGSAPAAFATEPDETAIGDESEIKWEKLGETSADRSGNGNKAASREAIDEYDDTDIVRVSIVLDEPSTLEKFTSPGGNASIATITTSPAAVAYTGQLETRQEAVAESIAREALDGEELDVVWNLTLITNVISANVPYGQIETIKGVSGVSDVFVEARFMPYGDGEITGQPAMSTSSEQIGSSAAYGVGLYGAGTRIAVIDTGTDPDHQSFSGAALAHALEMDFGDDYAEVLGLLDIDELTAVYDKLNVKNKAAGIEGMSPASLYTSEKLPFVFNYIDGSLDGSHDNDRMGAHGSHVAGIAAANRFIEKNGTFVSALEEAKVQGVAPDAQLLTMKVFGKGGGSYESDHFAAIEDALELKADVINLSIGTYMAGQTYSKEYADVLERLADSDTVVTVSAGNYGSYVDVGTENGRLYLDDVSMDTVGNPGAFTNALTVGSVDNIGATGYFITVDGHSMFYIEGSGSNPPMNTIGSDNEVDYVYLDSVGLVADYQLEPPQVTTEYEDQMKKLSEAIDGGLAGKVLVVNRGVSPFFAKGNAANALGVKALIVINNAAGSVGADMAGYNGSIPVVTVNQSAREYFASGSAQTFETEYDRDGNKADGGTTVSYYTGKLTISNELTSETFGTDSVISDFSAWGVPGDLSIKPEIAAPGGSIYSVDGSTAATDKYTTMSGTSMSAPQVAGMAALVAEYVKKNVNDSGISVRQLVQSLLMSTAVPLKDGEKYYPILQQGAGLANVGNAIRAESYITVEGQPDGKVKAELGEDAGREGVYSVTFTLHNLKDVPIAYDISADLFTQDITDIDGEKYMDTATTGLDADMTVYANGCKSDDHVEVPAGGTAEVRVELTLTDGAKAELEDYPTGAYIQGFIYATPGSYQDGVSGVRHSIPLLAFYGSWTEASMFERLSNEERIYGLGGLTPYTGVLDSNVLCVYYDGDLYDSYLMTVGAGEGGYEYLADRAAFDPALATLSSYYFTPIRNFANSLLQIVDAETGEVYFRQERGDSLAAFYDEDREVWHYADQTAVFDWLGTDMNGVDLPDGTTVDVSVTLAPELYVSESGTAWDKLGDGATISTRVTVDRSAPELLDVEDSHLEDDSPSITVKVRDNEYVSRVTLFSASDLSDEGILQDRILNQKNVGEATDVELDLDGISGENFILQIEDYAGHVSVYSLIMDLTAQVKSYYNFLSSQEECWYGYTTDHENGGVTGRSTISNIADAVYIDGYVFVVDAYGTFYATPYGDNANAKLIGTYNSIFDELNLDGDGYDYSVKAMDYNRQNGLLYVTYYVHRAFTWDGDLFYRSMELFSLDLKNGEFAYVGPLGYAEDEDQDDFETIHGVEAQALAVDPDGNFYGVNMSTLDTETYETQAFLYRWTLDTIENPEPVMDLASCEDINPDGSFALTWDSNSNALLISNTKTETIGQDEYYEDIDATFCSLFTLDVNSENAELKKVFSHEMTEIYDSVFGLYVVPDSAASYDFDGSGETDRIIDAQTLLDFVTGEQSRIIKNAYADLNGDEKINTFDVYELLHMELGSQTFAPTDDATGVVISQSGAELRVGGEMTLSAYADPWFLSDRSVNWTSSDTSVVTVSSKGQVKGVSPGVATVRASSVLDAGVYAECTVQVLAAEYELSGVIMDAGSQAQLFSMDVAHLEAWEKTADLSGDLDIISGAYYDPTDAPGDEYAYVMDSGFRIHKLDPATGEILASSGAKHYPLSDMTVLEGVSAADGPMILGVYGPMLLFGINGWDQDTFESGFLSMAYTLPQMGAEALVGVAYAGSFDEGETHYEVVYALDDVGDFWLIYFDFSNPENPILEQAIPYYTDLPADKVQATFQNVYLSSLAVSDIDTLLFSRQNGKTAEIYLLEREEYVENGDVVNHYSAARVTDMGEDCFPAVLFEAISTAVPDSGWDDDGGDDGEDDGWEDDEDDGWEDDEDDGWEDDHDYDGDRGLLTLNEALTPIAAKDPAVNAAVGGTAGVSYTNVSSTTVKLTVTVDRDTTNGILTLSYKPGEVRLGSVRGLANLVSVHDDKDGSITVAWACVGDCFKEGQAIVELTFERLDASVSSSAVRMTITELGGNDGTEVLEDDLPEPGEESFTFTAPAPSYTPPARSSVSLPGSVSHGAVKSDKLNASAGEKVTLTVTPEAGYSVDGVAVTDSSGRALDVTDNGDGTYTFTMPSSGVTVNVTFRCEGGENCPSRGFTDLDLTQWYHEDLDYVVEHGLMGGYANTTRFGTNDSLQRSEFVWILYVLAGKPAVSGGAGEKLTDIPEGAFYADAVEWASANGIVSGYGDGTFRPFGYITRDQMAVIMYRYAEYKGYDVSGRAELIMYTDVDMVNEWAEDAMSWIVDAGVILGKNGSLAPAVTATRAEAAAVVARFARSIVK